MVPCYRVDYTLTGNTPITGVQSRADLAGGNNYYSGTGKVYMQTWYPALGDVDGVDPEYCGVAGVKRIDSLAFSGTETWVAHVSEAGAGASDPVPPVPEAIAIALFGMGLMTLGGYIWYRRRHHQKEGMAAA